MYYPNEFKELINNGNLDALEAQFKHPDLSRQCWAKAAYADVRSKMILETQGGDRRILINDFILYGEVLDAKIPDKDPGRDVLVQHCKLKQAELMLVRNPRIDASFTKQKAYDLLKEIMQKNVHDEIKHTACFLIARIHIDGGVGVNRNLPLAMRILDQLNTTVGVSPQLKAKTGLFINSLRRMANEYAMMTQAVPPPAPPSVPPPAPKQFTPGLQGGNYVPSRVPPLLAGNVWLPMPPPPVNASRSSAAAPVPAPKPLVGSPIAAAAAAALPVPAPKSLVGSPIAAAAAAALPVPAPKSLVGSPIAAAAAAALPVPAPKSLVGSPIAAAAAAALPVPAPKPLVGSPIAAAAAAALPVPAPKSLVGSPIAAAAAAALPVPAPKSLVGSPIAAAAAAALPVPAPKPLVGSPIAAAAAAPPVLNLKISAGAAKPAAAKRTNGKDENPAPAKRETRRPAQEKSESPTSSTIGMMQTLGSTPHISPPVNPSAVAMTNIPAAAAGQPRNTHNPEAPKDNSLLALALTALRELQDESSLQPQPQPGRR